MRANLRHYSIPPGNYALIIPKQLREHLQAAKWSKTDIANFVHERAASTAANGPRSARALSCAIARQRLCAMESPDQLLSWLPADPPGLRRDHSPWLGNKSHAVTMAIGACVDCEPPKK